MRTFAKVFLLVACLPMLGALAGCGSCIDPWTQLSDCPSGTPGHRSHIAQNSDS